MSDEIAIEPVTITVDVVSDVCCPWCYLGKRRLEHAIERLSDVNVVVTWRPFQLDPTIPAEGVNRKDYMRAKFGDGGRIEEIHEHLAELGKAEGIEYDFDAIKTSPNSFNAHRLLRWAAEAGVQNVLKERLMSLFWTEGVDIGDLDVLAVAAGTVGLDSIAIRKRLATDDDRDTVAAEIAYFRRMGVQGVPTFIFEQKYAVSGAQEVSVLADAMRDVAEEKAFGPKM
jgi:predicted DsbA family dithiol-disulfide isomerase